LFLLSVYQFCIFIQNHKFGEGKIDLKLTKLLLVYSGINTFLVYAYQVLCLDEIVKNKIENSHYFLFENFQNLGLTIYKDENLYYNLLPHFFINFLSLLYLREMKRMSDKFNNINNINKINIIDNDKEKNKKIVLSNNPEKEKNKNEESEDDIFDIINTNKEEKEKEENVEEDEESKISPYEKYHSNKRKLTFFKYKIYFYVSNYDIHKIILAVFIFCNMFYLYFTRFICRNIYLYFYFWYNIYMYVLFYN
jgi:hypothetical protein